MQTLLYVSDSPSPPKAYLDILVSVAARSCQRMQAILLDDDQLRNVAAFPFAKEILRGSAATRSLSHQNVMMQLQRFNRLLERELVSMSRLALPETGVSLGTRQESVSYHYWQEMLQKQFSMLAVTLQQDLSSRAGREIKALYVLFDSSELAEYALNRAVEVAEEKKLPIVVLLAEVNGHDLTALSEKVSSIIRGKTTAPVKFQTIPLSNANSIATLKVSMSKFSNGLWFLPNSQLCFRNADLADLFTALKVPILLVNNAD